MNYLDPVDLPTSLRDLRREYASRVLDEASIDPDPIAQFRLWFSEALTAQILDANAMSVATVSPAGEPSVRTVLLKDIESGGFVFFTHYDSPKGRDLAANPRVSLLFYWAELERQVRINGTVSRVPRVVSETYFASRPVESQWAAWAGQQSAEVDDRASLERRYQEIKRQHPQPPVPCPPKWGGYHVAPDQMEFWQGRPGRLHDRIRFTKQADGTWARARLAP